MPVVLAVVIVILVGGSLAFHFLSPWYFTELASNWSTVDFTVDVTFWVTGIVFVLVNLFTAYCIVKFRHRPGRRAHYEPESGKLEGWLTAITAVGVAAMLVPGLFVWGDFVTVPDDAVRFEALGKQWHWSYRFPGDDGAFGKTNVRLLTPENPMGLDPEDPAGMDDILVNSPIVHLPMSRPVHALLRSTDVLHNFTVPQFRVKMDLVPGMVTYQWFTPTRPGTFDVLCEELCGIAHFAMRGKVVVEDEADFDAWLDAQPTFAETLAQPPGDASRGAATFAICAACHGQRGEGNPDLNAPKLAGQKGWYIRRQIRNYLAGVRGTNPLDTYGVQMAPMARTLATPQSLEDIIAHIETLPDDPAAETVVGNVDRGRKTFTTCAACHGTRGQGVWTTNAPTLSGMSDWFLVRQLVHFRENIRGGHADDIYGQQMHMFAGDLRLTDAERADDSASGDVDLLPGAAINDVVAYINTLR